MYERMNRSTGNALAYRIIKPLSDTEIKKIIIELEGTISAKGRIRILIDLQAFPYESSKAFLEDLKFTVKHAGHLERLALVGGKNLKKWAVRLFAALTFTKCRCFPEEEVDRAWAWLTEE
jgi:hypothetical protein